MKLLVLAFFVAVAASAPLDPSGDPVEVVVNGLAEGEALDVGHLVDVKVKEIVGGEVAAASNPLHPFTAQGLAEIAEAQAIAAAEAEAAAAAEAEPVVVAPTPVLPEVPDSIALPEPATPIDVPEPIALPEPAAPEVSIPEPVVLPEPAAPEVVPDPAAPEVVVPEPIAPESISPEVVYPAPVEEVPAPAPQLNGEVFNDGTVSITVNGPEDAGVYATLQSWVNLFLNYVNSGVQYTQQLI